MLAGASRLSPEQRQVVASAALRRWRDDPAAFAVEVLGIEPWSKQADILRATVTHRRVSVSSGHKLGKSALAAIRALHFACTQPDARVILLAPTWRQITEIVWREVKRLHAGAKFPLGGVVGANPDTGIRWRDGRQIIGFSTDSKERVAGFSGNLLYILDEASGIDDEVHEVVSTSPSGRVLMISNPTRTSGAFYESHHSKRDFWYAVRVSSEDAAAENPLVSEDPETYKYPHLANERWVRERLAEYGEDSPYADVRIRGKFPSQSDRAVIGLGLVEDAKKRYASTPCEGRLEIGVDVARFGSDDSCIVWRRGSWASRPIIIHGADNVSIAGRVLELVREKALPGERPIIRVDTSSGGGVADILRRHEGLQVEDVLAQESATSRDFARLRDQMWWSLRAWLQDGAIPDDARLIADLVSPTYDYDEKGRIKVESKRDLRARLSRSTDRADALALAVLNRPTRTWDPIVISRSTRG